MTSAGTMTASEGSPAGGGDGGRPPRVGAAWSPRSGVADASAATTVATSNHNSAAAAVAAVSVAASAAAQSAPSAAPSYFQRSAEITDIDARLQALQAFLATAKGVASA